MKFIAARLLKEDTKWWVEKKKFSIIFNFFFMQIKSESVFLKHIFIIAEMCIQSRHTDTSGACFRTKVSLGDRTMDNKGLLGFMCIPF